jgi:hypothetical protein
METNAILFKLHSIKTEQFATIDDIYSEGDVVQLESNYRFGCSADEHLVAIRLKYQFRTGRGVFLLVDASCVFDFTPESWSRMSDTDNMNLILPKQIATHLLVLSIGTVRGILHVKTENTFYNRFLLPTLDVSDTIREDIKISL